MGSRGPVQPSRSNRKAPASCAASKMTEFHLNEVVQGYGVLKEMNFPPLHAPETSQLLCVCFLGI